MSRTGGGSKPTGAPPSGTPPSDAESPSETNSIAARQAEASITGTADFPAATGGAFSSGGCGGGHKGEKHSGSGSRPTGSLEARQADFSGPFSGSDYPMATDGVFGSGYARPTGYGGGCGGGSNKAQKSHSKGGHGGTRTHGSGGGKHSKTGSGAGPTAA